MNQYPIQDPNRGPRHFIFNGKSSEDFEIIVNRVERPILPALRQRKLTVPGKHGVWDFGGNTYEERTISINCYVVDPLDPAGIKKTRDIARWISVKGSLIISDEPNIYHVGRVYDEIAQTMYYRVGEFQLPFVVEPFGYSTEKIIPERHFYDMGNQYNTGLWYPNEGTMSWSYQKQAMTFINYGSIDTDVYISITGSAQNFEIHHAETNRKIKFNVPLNNETIIIDTANFMISKGATNLLPYVTMTGGWFQLVPGENSFWFMGDGGSAVTDPKANIEYKFFSIFL